MGKFRAQRESHWCTKQSVFMQVHTFVAVSFFFSVFFIVVLTVLLVSLDFFHCVFAVFLLVFLLLLCFYFACAVVLLCF